MICPICQNPSDRIFQKNEFWIRECRKCHHRYAEISPSADHPYQIYQDDYFKGGAAGYSDYLSEAKILISHGRQYSRILKNFTNPGMLLDVGSAAGFILRGFQEEGWQGIGLEPNSSMSDYGRTHLGLQIESGSLELFSSAQRFDLVSMIQVIAHFYDIRQALKNAADVTRPGGFWLIETWDRESWIARCLGRYWHEYSPPGVLHWFTPAGLNLLAAKFGFSEVAWGHPVKRISGSHVKSLIEYSLINSPSSWLRGGLKIIPDHLILPYPTIDLFWMLFQKDTNLDF
jgi:SAM-dependent methyltransferase